MNSTQSNSTPSVASNSQRPLQIHLDVAAVEHDQDSYADRYQHKLDRPGLLSHYLQLADVDQQRGRLKNQQGGTGNATEPKRSEADHQQHSSSRCNSDTGFEYHLVTCPKRARTRTSLRKRSQSQSRSRTFLEDKGRQSTASMCDLDAHIDNKRISSIGITESQVSAKDNVCRSLQDIQVTQPVLREAFSEINLTKFLPYALSTPGIQTAIGSPSLSHRENSFENISEWVKQRANLFGDSTDTSNQHVANTENSSLNVRREQLLNGIHQLLVHQKFICMLAQAMMQYGAPLHHLEDNLSRISCHLRIKATFTTMPGLVLISFEDQATFTSETKIIRCPSGYDMHRLELTDKVFRIVSKGEISAEEGTQRLGEIMHAKPLFAWYWQLLDWGVTSWSVCILAFNGSWLDSVAALVLGMAAGCLNLLASRLKGYTNLFEASVSIVCGFLATAVERWVCFGAVTLSATAVLLPGLLLTTGIIELTSRNMHAGTVRVGYALTLAFILAFGINLGNNIYVEIFSVPSRVPDINMTTCAAASPWWWWLTFPVSISTICLLINVHPKHWHACIIVAGIMFSVFWYLVIHRGLSTVGPVVSAFVLGVAANIWSKVFKHNAYATMLPGMMILVPGSVGVRGIMTMFQGSQNGANSMQLVFQMIQTSLSIMVGLFASSFVVYPRGKKQSALITV
ncbi:pheromone-regulated protein prm10 [Coemansia sp. RSA 487]|nr:pheromone-regulated protein prm10 [Coemansia sp. RSA 487]